MDELLKRRRKMKIRPALYGNAITASSAAWYTTPANMPNTSRLIIDCWLNLTGNKSGGSDYQWFDFTASNTFFGRQSSNKTLRYRYYTNSYYTVLTIGDNTVNVIDLTPSSKYFTVTYSNGTTVNSGTTSLAWVSRTGNLRMHLRPNFYVKRIQQIDSGNVLSHDLRPAKFGNAIGMLDMVGDIFYPYDDGNAFITTI